MKKQWQPPVFEELDVRMTMAGPGKRYEDVEQNDPDEDVHYS